MFEDVIAIPPCMHPNGVFNLSVVFGIAGGGGDTCPPYSPSNEDTAFRLLSKAEQVQNNEKNKTNSKTNSKPAISIRIKEVFLSMLSSCRLVLTTPDSWGPHGPRGSLERHAIYFLCLFSFISGIYGMFLINRK